MSSAVITLYGMAKFFSMRDDDLFKNLNLPVGIDKQILTNNIILKGAEFEVLYSDAYFMQDVIGNWGDKWNRTFTKWITALNLEYNPLENYDRIEEWDETDSGNVHNVGSGTNIENTTDNGSNSTENKISAFNSETYQPDTTLAGTSSNTIEAESSMSNLADITHEKTNNKTGRAHGNIGVTTSQQMLQAELDLASWNIYEHITDLFLREFIIPIY